MNEWMSQWLPVLNGMAVGIFGMILSAAFCDVVWSKQKRIWLALCMVGLLLIQGVVYFFMDQQTVRYLYPLMMHVPLALVLCLFQQKILWSVISVFTAYLCCYPRRWVALLVVSMLSGSTELQNIVELIVTIPLLVLLLKFVAPAIIPLSRQSVLMQWQFGLIPIVTYAFDYLTQTYTNLFFKGNPVVAEFMSFICSAAYLGFLLWNSETQRVRMRLEEIQDNLNLQVSQAVREIEHLRGFQQQTRTYRHDLRHHLQYLSSCIENGRLDQARAYIQNINAEIEAGTMQVFCENETANLIFSDFVNRAQKYGIPFSVKARIPGTISVSESDLCVLLSNAMENALNASLKCREKGLPFGVDTSVYEKGGKLFLQIVNLCDDEVTFENGVPVTDLPGHGIGMRSICALVDKYEGAYQFVVKENKFILRLSV